MIVKNILRAVIPFVIVFMSHYVAVHIYAELCVPFSLKGLITSLITTASPWCTGLITIINNTHNMYIVVVAGVIVSLVTGLRVAVTGI